ncbi:ral guanine nucleotide dissociation stimulator-like 2 isoform X2 [Carettochelys insculpta]|uniref:ral guanine nucleotide dissociation stimulator-like 2 isoform X2 n=1 Tax=Carettochelys insculpta TaxID=44489 RepID=UPI003EB94DE6
MLPRSLRHLLEGTRLELGEEQGVTLSAYRSWSPQPPQPQPPVTQTEEAEEGAIYTVTTRPPGAPGGSTQCRLLKAGSLARLVQHLLEAQVLGDAAYVPAFLVTCRAFTRPPAMLALLLDRLEEVGALKSGPVPPETSELQRAFSSVLCSWLDGYPEDFGEALEPGLVERLRQGLQRALGQGSEAERRLLAVRGALGEPNAGGELEEEEWKEGESAGPEVGLTPTGDPDPLDILTFQAEHVAAELTRVEAALFLRVVPYQCLGSLWSQRDKKGQEQACPSVRATVRQFNHLAGAVICTCLARPGLRPQQRARVLEKWVHVAQECRTLRNFSSLYAIVSALQSSPVHRLKRTWDEIARDAQQSYEELSSICSEQDNYSLSRQLLFQEGTRRQASPDLSPRRQPRRPSEQHPVGVVPYLGTFLRDLVMLDAAVKDKLKNGYINFEKRRKEFEVLAQLRLLQSVCRNYRIQPSLAVQRWLQGLAPLSEAQSHSLSCEIEPPSEVPAPQRPLKPTLIITHCAELLSSVGSPLVSWDKPSSHEGPPTCSPDLLLLPSGPTELLTHLEQSSPLHPCSVRSGRQSQRWMHLLRGHPPQPGASCPPALLVGACPGGTGVPPLVASAFPAPPTPEPGPPPCDCRIIRAPHGPAQR